MDTVEQLRGGFLHMLAPVEEMWPWHRATYFQWDGRIPKWQIPGGGGALEGQMEARNDYYNGTQGKGGNQVQQASVAIVNRVCCSQG